MKFKRKKPSEFEISRWKNTRDFWRKQRDTLKYCFDNNISYFSCEDCKFIHFRQEFEILLCGMVSYKLGICKRPGMKNINIFPRYQNIYTHFCPRKSEVGDVPHFDIKHQ